MGRIPAVVAMLLVCSASLPAHEILDPVQVNRILKSMQQAHRSLAAAATTAEKQEALFNVGVEAYALMKLINADIKEHGRENQGLIDLAVNRCKTVGVNISPIGNDGFYLYDFEAFTSYLKLSPRGERAAEARFALIEKSFYQQQAGQATAAAVLEQVEEKRQLLRDFPKFGRRADLEMFLIMDYLELSSHYLEDRDVPRSTKYKELALQLCREVAEKYPDTEAASFARNLLIRLGL